MTDPDVTLYQLARAWSDSIDARTPTRRFPPFDRPGRSYGWSTGGDASTLDPAECSDVAWLLTVSRGARPERIAERAAHRERARSLLGPVGADVRWAVVPWVNKDTD